MLICICGDSYFSLDFNNPNSHWSELLDLNPQVKLVNLAVTGASNVNIRQQVKYAVNCLKADGIILTATNHNRLDLRKDILFHSYNQPFTEQQTIYFKGNKTYEYFWNPAKEWLFHIENNWTYRSMTLSTAIVENQKHASNDFQKNFNKFFLLLRDDSVECEKDFCVIQQTLNEFENKILFFDPRLFDKMYYNFTFNSDKFINLTNRFEFDSTTTYHTAVEEQKILAAEVKEKLKNLYNIY